MQHKQDTFESEKYRRWIASLPCLVTGRQDVQCAHIRLGSDAGMGRKPPDYRTLPLCVDEHRRQHEIGELRYWYPFGGYESAVVLARQLYEVRFDASAAIGLLTKYRHRFISRGLATRNHKFIDEREGDA